MLLLLCFIQLMVIAQQPSFENLKASDDPYLQFNDVTEFEKKVLFVTNNGLYQFHNHKIVPLIIKENLARFIKVDNKLFIWSIYGEVFELKSKKLIPLPFNNLLSKRLNNKIINSVIYNDSTFWISTVVGGGIIKVDQKNEEIKTSEIEASYPYYVAQYGSQLISGNNANPTKKELAIGINSPYYIPLAEELSFSKTNVLSLKDGSYIFTRQYEAIRFSKTKIINRVFVEKNIEAIYQSTDGKVWFTLNNGGTICFTDGNFNTSSSIRYLGNKTVISIYEDKLKNMWFGTSGNGIYLLKSSAPLEYNPPKIFSSTNTKTEQIKSVSTITNFPIIDSNSRIIRTDALKSDTIPPVVFINNIKINGADTTTLNYYELNHNQNNIEFNISGVFGGKSELQYKYILEGKEKEWNYSTNTNVYYTSLTPGNYTFKVFAMSDTGIWSKIPAVLSFSINTPFYSSLWFISSAIFLLIAVVLIIIFIINRKAQLKDKALEEEKRKVLVSELHALRSQMDPHFIFNTLSSIQSFITKNSSKDAVNYLSKFSKLMRGTLENTKKQKISIKDEIEILELYMDLEKLRLDNKFNYQITIDENIDIQFEEIPPMLIQPYVENAIWHGISHKTSLGLIKISFQLVNENLLKCEIEDDGVGRVRAGELNKKVGKNTSLGMSITKERLEIINSLKNSKLNINIIDLEENNISKGTKIELFIPLD
jgi:sensor histidine kinase YesM